MTKQFGNYLEKFSLSDGQLAFKDWTGAWLVVHFQGGTAYRYDGKPLSERNWAREESKKGSAEARTLPMFPNGNDLQSKKRKVFGECDINDDSVDSLKTWNPAKHGNLVPNPRNRVGGRRRRPQLVRRRLHLNTLSLNENKANGSNGVVIPVTKDFTQLPRRISGQSRAQGSATRSKAKAGFSNVSSATSSASTSTPTATRPVAVLAPSARHGGLLRKPKHRLHPGRARPGLRRVRPDVS